MSSKIQEKIAPRIYRLESGAFRVKVSLGNRARGGQTREKTFPCSEPACGSPISRSTSNSLTSDLSNSAGRPPFTPLRLLSTT
jgi:hypothetical protein